VLEDYSFSLYKPILAVTYTNDKYTFHVRNLFGGAPLEIVAVKFGASYSHICVVLRNSDACRIKDCLWTSRVLCVSSLSTLEFLEM
jgi:hypothetical protein